MFLVILWLCCGLVGSKIAEKKGNGSCGGFALGILLGPIGLLIAYFSNDNVVEQRKRTGHTRRCRYCAEYIKQDALICKHCGRPTQDGGFDLDKYRVQ